MRKFLLSAWLWLAFGLLTACAPPPYENVDNAALRALLDEGVPLIDIRTAAEWKATGVIAGSHRITFTDADGRVVPQFFGALPAVARPDQPLILICRSGNRSDVLARLLMEQLGYTRVYNVQHGIGSWIRSGGAVQRI